MYFYSNPLTPLQVGGDPQPEISWSRQGKPLTDQDNVQMVTERGITLLNLHPDHQGEYLCTATNKAGSISASATLRVEVSEVKSVPRHFGFSRQVSHL